MTNEEFAVGVIILAAGASRRMGKPKLLLPWGQTSVLGHLLQQCGRLRVRQAAVVCAAGAEPLDQELNRLCFPKGNRIFNPAPGHGMFSSIQCAANWPDWKAELTHWLIMLGDQPHLRPETLQTLIDFGAQHPVNICQPIRDGHRKHPVLLPKTTFVELQNCAERDLKQFLHAHSNESAGFESDDSGLDLDIDTPEDYERARGMYFGGTSSASPQS
jgi:molybdenum cofactor cytidylyltransferase